MQAVIVCPNLGLLFSHFLAPDNDFMKAVEVL